MTKIWEDNDWKNYYSHLYTYAGVELIASETTAYWSSESEAWINEAKEEYTYNEATDYIIFACYIEKGDDGNMKVVGNIETQEFTTFLKGTMMYEFEEFYHFGSYNAIETSDSEEQEQWMFYGKNNKDLFTWDVVKKQYWGDSFVPSAADWWLIFRSRSHADELFTLATITNIKSPNSEIGSTVHGLIVLPFDWQAPEGVTLKSAKEIGLVWNEEDEAYKASSASFDGYAENILDERTDWWALEAAGAVFLPAAGVNGGGANSYGWYWAETSSPRAFSFGKDNLYLRNLTHDVYPVEGRYSSIRLMRKIGMW